MELKYKVLKALEEKRGQAVSGETLATEFNVSRSAIWKAVKSLRQQGIDITAGTNKGYVLAVDSNSLSSAGINAILGENRYIIETRKSVTSTNTILKEMAVQGADEYTVLVAEEQTLGRGRFGRRFESPKGTGIYLSILLKPKMKAEDALFITTSAAVAVANAVEALNKKPNSVKIKWVNDLFLDNRKICGILTEAAIDFESGGLEYAILGIGINISPSEEVNEKLSGIAGSIFKTDIPNSRNQLTAQILKQISKQLDNFGSKECLDEYRLRSFLDNKMVTVIGGETRYLARVVGIDDKARLVVQLESGDKKTISSGEVSLSLEV
ncbi:MAG: biotin--[acetyl-CoA-carboxylase] ligase [Clostridiales bacterium]|nr:biotin--[acetyl-CoA-carboxylase] ligase [Clostridiales bacterium]